MVDGLVRNGGVAVIGGSEKARSEEPRVQSQKAESSRGLPLWLIVPRTCLVVRGPPAHKPAAPARDDAFSSLALRVCMVPLLALRAGMAPTRGRDQYAIATL